MPLRTQWRRCIHVVGHVVGQGHRVEREERSIPVLAHEFDKVLHINVRAVAVTHIGQELAIPINEGTVVARPFMPSEQRPGVETQPSRMVHVIAQEGELPLTCHGGGVAEFPEIVRHGLPFEPLREGSPFRIPDAKRIPPRQ